MMTQPIRNQLSLLAWMFAALCAWLLFLAAVATASPQTPVDFKTAAKAPRN
jgi:uncharacterized membrane protein YbhN (UPF0104 family)